MTSLSRNSTSPPRSRRFDRAALAVAVAAMAGVTFAGAPLAQTTVNQSEVPAIVGLGDAVVTGFSGATQGQSAETRFIDLDGPSMQVLSLVSGPLVQVSDGGAGRAKLQLKAGQIGQVFGVALDDNTVNGQKAPNIYITATSAFGIQIVKPDSDGDGAPDRTKTGDPQAMFMDGQFGGIEGAGPGSIYKVDGVTGEVSLFANISLDGQPNSGPGLGNIAFDKATRQLFVSDLDTGMIHRLDLAGNLVDHFDHGSDGRTSVGATAVPHDSANRMDITAASFNSEDPSTWGLAKPERRAWGLAVHAGRLYYAVNNSVREVWSVGLGQDGSFASDARLEISVPISDANPLITDLAFDGHGRIYLAQRGSLESGFDYTVFAKASVSQVLRYGRDPSSGGWMPAPDSYAIGIPADHMEAAGGIAIGNHVGTGSGYQQRNACDFLWSTGDTLEPQQIVHGVQGNAINLVRPANAPPVAATFTVYDERPGKDGTEGHVGDIEVLRDCEPSPATGVIPVHWKSGSTTHSKSRSHHKYGSSAHSKQRSHWKYGSNVHTKQRSHWKHASSEHSKRRSHWKYGSTSHTKQRSHWKYASNEHSKRRSHWKYGSNIHTKFRSHWKYASNEHSKWRSHWKYASDGGTHRKIRSHFKWASTHHGKRRSHWKFLSVVHVKGRSHFKPASKVHKKIRSHFKRASVVHTKRRSHFKLASKVHTKMRSHFKLASKVHTKRRSHFKLASKANIKRRNHRNRASGARSRIVPNYRKRSQAQVLRFRKLKSPRSNARLR
ncbi:MAG: hypothetical protein ACR2PI_11595 [Hyphomicrobiaceae bacterium]